MERLRTGVLLLHGLTGMPGEMRPVGKYLESLGFPVEIPLLAGHGGSHEDLLATGWKDWLDSARDALARLLESCDQVVVGGLSMGSTMAAMLAAEEPRVAGVVMFSPTLAYDGSSVDGVPFQRIVRSRFCKYFLYALMAVAPVFKRILYGVETAPYGLKDPRLQRQITRAIEAAERGETTEFGLFRTYYASLIELDYMVFRFRTQAAQVRCPVFMLHSVEDTVVRPVNATDTYAMLGSKDKTLVMLTGCDHVLTLDLERKFVGRLVGDFVCRVAGLPSPRFENLKTGLSCRLQQNDLAGNEHLLSVWQGKDCQVELTLVRGRGSLSVSPGRECPTGVAKPVWELAWRTISQLAGSFGDWRTVCDHALTACLRPSGWVDRVLPDGTGVWYHYRLFSLVSRLCHDRGTPSQAIHDDRRQGSFFEAERTELSGIR